MVAGAMKKARLLQAFADRSEIDSAELFFRREWKLERGAFQMVDQDFQIVGLDERVLRRAAEEIIRMLHDELIHRRGGCHENRAGAAAAASCAAGALPGGGDRTWVASEHHGIEGTDVNAQFECVGRNHAADAAFAQAALDLAAFPGQIAAAIAAHGLRSGRKRQGWPVADR